jgi:hypothetical protein
MAWNFVNSLAIAPRRRLVATALVYGLSLAVRFTSAAGEQTEIPPQALQGFNPMTSIMINDGAQLFNGWPSKPGRPIGSPRWLLGSRGCGAACESPMATPSCSSPP